MVKVCSSGQMGGSTTECSKLERKMAKACTIGLQAKFMKVSSRMISALVRELSTTQTVKLLLDCGKMERNTEKAITNGQTVQNITLCTLKAKRGKN
jgi:hypothetical protein